MKKEKLIIDGNAFYELDLDCLERKRKNRKASAVRKPDTQTELISKKRQRK